MSDEIADSVTPQFKDDSARACIRALRGLETTAKMLEENAPEIFPEVADGKKHFGRVVMESAAAEIRAAWVQAIGDVETRVVDDPVEHLSTQVLREEVRFWRANAAAALETAIAVITAGAKTYGDREATYQVAILNPWRAALAGAITGDYHELCEHCSMPVRPGDLVVTYADVGDVHARCVGLEGEQLQAGAKIPVDPASLELDEGEERPTEAFLTVTEVEEHYTAARIASVLERAFAVQSSQGVCRICGCDDDHACITDDGPCSWVEDDLCSAPICVGLAKSANYDRLKSVVIAQTGAVASWVTPDRSLSDADGLGLDALDRMELAVAIEEAFAVKISDELEAPLQTIGELAQLVDLLVAEQKAAADA